MLSLASPIKIDRDAKASIYVLSQGLWDCSRKRRLVYFGSISHGTDYLLDGFILLRRKEDENIIVNGTGGFGSGVKNIYCSDREDQSSDPRAHVGHLTTPTPGIQCLILASVSTLPTLNNNINL